MEETVTINLKTYIQLTAENNRLKQGINNLKSDKKFSIVTTKKLPFFLPLFGNSYIATDEEIINCLTKDISEKSKEIITLKQEIKDLKLALSIEQNHNKKSRFFGFLLGK